MRGDPVLNRINQTNLANLRLAVSEGDAKAIHQQFKTYKRDLLNAGLTELEALNTMCRKLSNRILASMKRRVVH